MDKPTTMGELTLYQNLVYLVVYLGVSMPVILYGLVAYAVHKDISEVNDHG